MQPFFAESAERSDRMLSHGAGNRSVWPTETVFVEDPETGCDKQTGRSFSWAGNSREPDVVLGPDGAGGRAEP